MKTDLEIVIELMESLDDIEYINCGGCLFAAYAVYLKARDMGIKTSVVQIDKYDNFIPTNRAFLKGIVEDPTAGNHYAVKVGSSLVDSTGELDIPYRTFTIRTHKDIVKLCETSLKMKGMWNSAFDRLLGVKMIKQILGIDLSYLLAEYPTFDTWFGSFKASILNGYVSKEG